MEKEIPHWVNPALTAATGIFGFLCLLIVRGAKGYVLDVSKVCRTQHAVAEKKIEQLQAEQKTFVQSNYIRDEIKPVLEGFDRKLDDLAGAIARLVPREEWSGTLTDIHKKIDKETDVLHHRVNEIIKGD